MDGNLALSIESRITKAINIITAVQQTCPVYVADSLEEALDILRETKAQVVSPTTLLNNQSLTDVERVDVLGTLLTLGTRPMSTALHVTNPFSSDQNTASPLPIAPKLDPLHFEIAPAKLQRLLGTVSNWDFDVILLEEITEKRPLVWTGMAIFSKFQVAQTLRTDDATLRNWLTLIEANYRPSNPYHNSTHAADVLQATAYFLSKDKLKQFLTPLDQVASLIAAIVHDVDHPGKTNQFLTNTGDPLSLLYNDATILESYHAAFAFKLSRSDPRVNIFKNLSPETFKEIRKIIIDMIYATEMSKHFEHLSKFATAFQHMGSEADVSKQYATPENKILLKRMLIKCADVSNPTRPIKLCTTWANRITEEYFRQTEEEIALGLPPAMPTFDRKTCSIPNSQTGFVDFFISNMYKAWDAFLDIPELLGHMKFNYNFWKDLERRGILTAGQVNDHLRKMKEGSMIT